MKHIWQREEQNLGKNCLKKVKEMHVPMNLENLFAFLQGCLLRVGCEESRTRQNKCLKEGKTYKRNRNANKLRRKFIPCIS